MPSSKARKDTIVEGCSNVLYVKKVMQKGQKHAKLSEALRLYGYDVTSSHYICGSIRSQYHSSNDTMSTLGIIQLQRSFNS